MSKLFDFMKLPTEIRHIVYRELLGDTIISLGIRLHHEPHNSPLPQSIPAVLHIECARPRVGLAGNDVSFSIFSKAERKAYGIEHDDIAPILNSDTPVSTPGTLGKYYEIIQANRTTYQEAAHVLYSTNIFSFRYAEALGRFCRTLTPTQLSSLNSIQISEGIFSAWNLHEDPWVWSWDRVLKSLPYGFFQNLHILRLDLVASEDLNPTDNSEFKMAGMTVEKFLETIEWMARVKGLKVQKIPVEFRFYAGPPMDGFEEEVFMKRCALPIEKKTRTMRDDTLAYIRSGPKLDRDNELEEAFVVDEEGGETDSEAEKGWKEDTMAAEEEVAEEAVTEKEVIHLTGRDPELYLEEALTFNEVIDLTGADSEADDDRDLDDSEGESSIYKYTSKSEESDDDEEIDWDDEARSQTSESAKENWTQMMGYER